MEFNRMAVSRSTINTMTLCSTKQNNIHQYDNLKNSTHQNDTRQNGTQQSYAQQKTQQKQQNTAILTKRPYAE